MTVVEGATPAAGARLRALRKTRGYSQSELSRRTVTIGDLGVAEITIRSIENGKREGSPETFIALARALGVGEDEFPEIRLARARCLFDERELGLDAALENYERLIAGLDQAADAAEAQTLSNAVKGLRELREAFVRQQAAGSTPPAVPQPQVAADQPAHPRRPRRRSA